MFDRLESLQSHRAPTGALGSLGATGRGDGGFSCQGRLSQLSRSSCQHASKQFLSTVHAAVSTVYPVEIRVRAWTRTALAHLGPARTGYRRAS